MTVVVMLLIYAGPSLYRMVKFNLFPSKVSSNSDVSKLIDDLSFVAEDASLSSATKSPSINVSEVTQTFDNNWFYYPELGIEAPMIWDVTLQQIDDRLLGGIVQLDQSAKPGEFGDIIVSGHSSFYPWVKSDYKETFAVLPEAEVGDRITIRRDDLYIYEVVSKKVIDSTKYLEYQVGGNSPGKLMIMTCYPIGTNIDRMLVEAKFIKKIDL